MRVNVVLKNNSEGIILDDGDQATNDNSQDLQSHCLGRIDEINWNIQW